MIYEKLFLRSWFELITTQCHTGEFQDLLQTLLAYVQTPAMRLFCVWTSTTLPCHLAAFLEIVYLQFVSPSSLTQVKEEVFVSESVIFKSLRKIYLLRILLCITKAFKNVCKLYQKSVRITSRHFVWR